MDGAIALGVYYPENDMLMIYLANTQIPDDKYNCIYKLLPEFRRLLVDKRKSEEAKRETALAFFLLMYGLKKQGIIDTYSEIDKLGYSAGEHGKPYLFNRKDIHFSISHTSGMVMCAVSDAEVGCDVEKKKKNRDEIGKIASRFFAEKEAQKIEESTDNEAVDEFFRIWTGKESYVKRNGLGMTMPFDEFCIYDCETIPVTVWENDSFVASVCCENKDYSVEEINWSSEELIDE